MAEIAENEVEIGPGEVLVERKIVPAHRQRTSPLAVIILLALVATCVVVFFGDKLGLRERNPQPVPAQTTPPAP